MSNFDLKTEIGRFEKDIDDAMSSAELLEIYCFDAKVIVRDYRRMERELTQLREAINLAVATEGETEKQAILRTAQQGNGGFSSEGK